MRQIEKKYLSKESVIQTLPKDLKPKHITEFYTVIKVCKEIKYAKIDDLYFRIIKTGIAGHKDFHKEEVSQTDYEKALRDKRIGDVIQKNRYDLTMHTPDAKLYLDIYQTPLDNLTLIEADFDSRNEQIQFDMPSTLLPYITKEVTKDERYQYKNLALLGDPVKNPYNIYAIFKDIELGRLDHIDEVVFAQMKSSDAIRIALFKYLIELKLSHDKIVQTEGVEGIDEFYAKVKKSRLLLKEYQKIFDKDITPKVIKHLKMMETSLKKHRDLVFIQNILIQMDEMLDKDDYGQNTEKIQKEIEKERHQIKSFFMTREFAIIFKQYELLLRENNKSFYAIDGQTSIKNSLEEKINHDYNQTLQLCEKYEGCQDEESYATLKSNLRSLILLLNTFEITKDSQGHRLLKKRIKHMKTSISQLQEIKKKDITLQYYLDHATVKPKLYKSIKDAIKTQSSDALKKEQKVLFKQNEKLASLKPYFK